MSPTTLALRLDDSAMQADIAQIQSLCLEAGNIPEGILQLLRQGFDAMGEEIFLNSAVAARGADHLVIEARFKVGGNISNALIALRALVFGDGDGHGDLSAKNGLGGTDHSSGEVCCVGLTGS